MKLQNGHNAVLRRVGVLDVLEHDRKLKAFVWNFQGATARSASHCSVMGGAAVDDGAFLERLEASHMTGSSRASDRDELGLLALLPGGASP